MGAVIGNYLPGGIGVSGMSRGTVQVSVANYAYVYLEAALFPNAMPSESMILDNSCSCAKSESARISKPGRLSSCLLEPSSGDAQKRSCRRNGGIEERKGNPSHVSGRACSHFLGAFSRGPDLE